MSDLFTTAFFTEDGVPKTGLTPTVSIWRLSDNVQVLTNQLMSEVASGFYSYEWVAYDFNENYVIQFNAGTDDVDSRYLAATNDSFLADSQEVLASKLTQEFIQKLVESDQVYDESAGLLHYYEKGTTTDLIPAKSVAGSFVPNDVTIQE